MQVGDLVRVYNFSKRARVVLKDNENSEDYTLGLILEDTSATIRPRFGRVWKVQLLQHPQVRESYEQDRLEVESASR